VTIRLTIGDRWFAENAIRGPHPYTHLVSITDSNFADPCAGAENVKRVLHLSFDDITVWRPQYVLPNEDHVRTLVRFARALPQDCELLVHCEAGISRSTAAAFTILATVYGPSAEARALADVYHVRPAARPNTLMVQLADLVLERKGAMERQLEALSALHKGRR
jgi:predicted protein tyrosine phosphatase